MQAQATFNRRTYQPTRGTRPHVSALAGAAGLVAATLLLLATLPGLAVVGSSGSAPAPVPLAAPAPQPAGA